jgi:hypothetical protein
MNFNVKTVSEYLENVPTERKQYFFQLRESILDNLPYGFEEQLRNSMIAYVVPHKIYPPGYHVDPQEPLPFVSIASQKNFIGLYHMGLYTKKELLDWFITEYPKHSKYKLDMGKSCVRLKKPNDIPFQLIGELMQKMTVQEWISLYEQQIRQKKQK